MRDVCSVSACVCPSKNNTTDFELRRFSSQRLNKKRTLPSVVQTAEGSVVLCRKQSEEVFAEFHLYLAGDEAGARGVFVGGDEQHVVLEGDEIAVESANDRAVAFG